MCRSGPRRRSRNQICDGDETNGIASAVGTFRRSSKATCSALARRPALPDGSSGNTRVVVDALDKPVLVINGGAFEDLDGFAQQFTAYLHDHVWHGNLDAFNDILRGGFGTPEGGFVLRWQSSERSKELLGPVLFGTLVEIIRTHGPGGDEAEDGVELELM